ncbi:MAG: IPT/TIG domain-containing protein [Betaproteobacteria bacterium]|nr:IPT/TIG domain-containing protein [Betaproteobacteria bacterium]
MRERIRSVLLFLSLLCVSGIALAVCDTQPINYGETKNGVLATDDCVDHNANGKDYYYDFYEFSGTSGQQILITNNSTVIDPDLLLIFPDDTNLYNDDGGGGLNSRIPATSGFLTLTQTGKHYIVASSAVSVQTGAYTLTLTLNAPPPPPPTSKQTFEFYNTALNHYFVTADPAEATAIENGSAGAGWVRTGYSYDVYGSAQAAQFNQQAPLKAATNPVCRFYGTPGVGPNSHFYTADAGECTIVKTDPGWLYEGIAYHIQQPQFGNCPAGTQPIYRAYNNRHTSNDANHRFITNKATFLAMGDQGWTMEGIVMCTTSVRSPAPVTGGTFKDSSGAGFTVAPGQLPGYVNATQPSTTPSSRMPPGLVNPPVGDTNVTQGAGGYDFNLTGDSGFTSTTAGAVTVSMPFNAAAIPAADQGNPVKTFTRVYDPQDGSQLDITGDITTAGSSGMMTIETRGLPRQFTAVVIHNPNMDAVTSDQAAVNGIDGDEPSNLKVTKTTWPAQSWCIVYNQASPDLIAAVKSVLGIAGNPTAAQIRSVILDKVGANARRSQTIYENHGHIGPNLVTARTCGGAVLRYNIHMTTEGSFYQPNDPGEAISVGRNHFGRLYVSNSRVDDSANTDLGSVLASVSHEMHHAVQMGYELVGGTTWGVVEGAATVYGKTIDNAEALKVRSETEALNLSLMAPGLPQAYGNEDFFAYVARQYNAGSLNYMSGLYAQLDGAIAVGVNNPAASVMYAAMHTYFTAAFAQSLQAIYLDFLKQRALTHNAASQFGRPGEVVSGFAETLFGGGVFKQDVNLGTCAAQKLSFNYPGIDPFSARALVLNPVGTLPAGVANRTLVVKITPTASSIGALWNGFTFRSNAAANLAAINKFTLFGSQAGDQVVLIVANLDPANTGSFDFEIGCAGLAIDSIAPVKGPVGTQVTINGTGFGTAMDTRAVYFNGLRATTVTFNSDTQAVATVPQNASTGDVVVEVNAERSNGVNFEVIAQCSATQNAGGDTPDTRTIELGKLAGTFLFTFETYSQEDRIIVRYQNATVFDTGCVGASGTQPISYNGASTQISVQVIPNCMGGSGTAWNYSVSCP